MQEKRYVIIGNGIAGTTAAETLRSLDPNCNIILLTNEAYPLYNRVSLPRLLQGKLTEEKVMIHDLAWHESLGLTLRLETLVTSIHPEEHIVETANGEHIPYDALLIATGGWANALQSKGADRTKNIYNFVTLDDSRAIVDRMQNVRTAIAYGGSFIAYELCDAFAAREVYTTWVMRSPYWLRKALDQEGGAVVDSIAEAFGVEVLHNDEIAEVHAQNGILTGITTREGKYIQADILGIGLGLTLNTSFLHSTGMTQHTGIVTDEYLHSSIPDIYAAGDIAEFYDTSIQSHHTLGTWDNAQAHGRIAAINMAGGHEAHHDVPTYTSPLFNVNIAVIGTAEAENPDMTILARRESGEKGTDNYRKLFFQEDRLVGAVMIGSPKGRKKLVELVREHTRFPSSAEREGLLELK